MANSRKEVLEELDEDLRHIKSGVDSAKEWSNVTARIADALEHMNLMSTLQFLGMQGKETDVYISGHRIDCPACIMIRKARPMDLTQIQRVLKIPKGPEGLRG